MKNKIVRSTTVSISVAPPSYVEAIGQQPAPPSANTQPTTRQQHATQLPPITRQQRPNEESLCKRCYVAIGKLQARSRDDKDFHERLIRIMCFSSMCHQFQIVYG